LSVIGRSTAQDIYFCFGIAAAVVLVGRRSILAELGQNNLNLQKFSALPPSFAARLAVLTLFILIRIFCIPPTNHTAFTYRIPAS
jgi:hypothetical protein